jgi:DNA-binding NtrC family response regulator
MSSERALVVDDDLAMCELLLDLLVGWGYDCETAASVEGALRCLRGHRFEVVVSDVRLGGPDGFELLARIRARWPECRVILMSAFPAPDTEKRALESGAAGFLAKPFALEALETALQRSRLLAPPPR